MSIFTKRSKRQVFLQSSDLISNNFLEQVFEVGVLAVTSVIIESL